MIVKFKFTSKRERKLWIGAMVILVAIYITLFLGGRLIDLMIEKRIIEQSTFYLFLVLVVSFIISGWKNSEKKLEYWIYAGVIAVYGMALLRTNLTVAERSHMFEYGLLAIFVYEALKERKQNLAKGNGSALMAIVSVGSIGLIDECIQCFLPYRVFDFVDIGFNYLASTFGVLTNIGVSWLQRILQSLFKSNM